jgi:aminomethyltransferase
VGLDIDWPALEKLYATVGLTPRLAGRTSRVPVPVYNKSGKQVGQVTSSTFSPILKKYIALATVESQYAAPGTQLNMEVTVEYSRKQAPATVVKLPFFEPERKKA